MNEQTLETIVGHLRSRGIVFEKGLSDTELKQVESLYAFRFPADLAQLLKFSLPVSKDFPNWRNDPENTIREWLRSPLEGIFFDIENNDFWLNTWGSKPQSLNQCFEIAEFQVNNAPRLIPIYAHRFMPQEPSDEGNPIFSVWQTDIIYYGVDLIDYLQKEFHVPINSHRQQPRGIRFWDELVS